MSITTSALVNTYLGTNSYAAAQITAAVNAANTGIESYCNRRFARATHREWLYLNGVSELCLTQYPLCRLKRLSNGTKNAVRLEFANTSAVSAQASVADGKLYLSSIVTGSAVAGYAEFTLSDYVSMAALKTAIDANTDLDSGWTITVENEDRPEAIRPMSTDDLYNNGCTWLEAPDCSIPQAGMDIPSGLLTFTGNVWGWVYVEYEAGYDTIPDDLAQIATEYAVAILANKDSQGAVSSLKLADAAYTFRDASQLLTQFGDRLDAYRRRSSL